jgi:hypothetical protein
VLVLCIDDAKSVPTIDAFCQRILRLWAEERFRCIYVPNAESVTDMRNLWKQPWRKGFNVLLETSVPMSISSRDRSDADFLVITPATLEHLRKPHTSVIGKAWLAEFAGVPAEQAIAATGLLVRDRKRNRFAAI